MSETLTKSETAKARKKGWLHLLAGVRLSSFHGDVSGDVADPLFGATQRRLLNLAAKTTSCDQSTAT